MKLEINDGLQMLDFAIQPNYFQIILYVSKYIH